MAGTRGEILDRPSGDPLPASSASERGAEPGPAQGLGSEPWIHIGAARSQPEIADLALPQLDYLYLRFDEGTGTLSQDSSEHDSDATLVEGAAWEAGGRLGYALDLAGAVPGPVGPHAVLAVNPLATCTDELTVSVWVKLRSLDSWARAFDFGTANTVFIYLTPYDGDGNVRFAMAAPAGPPVDIVSATPLVPGDNTWHHLAVTVAADDTVTLYVDGAVAQTGTSPLINPSDFNAMTDLWLGKSRFPDPFLDGSIDDLRVSCRAYTFDEIRNLSNP